MTPEDAAEAGVGVQFINPSPELRRRISELFAQINANPKLRSGSENLGFAPIDIPYEEVAKFIAEKQQGYLKLAKEAGIEPIAPAQPKP